MAQRDLTVRLRADIGQYRKAMADASKSTDQVARAGQALQNVGRSVSSVGDNLTRSVTLPLALAGAAAVKMAGDFDATFTQMQTLAGVSASEVDALKESVLDLAGETGKAPQELAEALYFLRSSGLDASGAMEALEVSAKASAAGLGDTVVLADAVSSAMMAYAEAGLTAAEATDVLVATARAGKAEPSELAGELGRLIPLSAELGISFADVGGAVAALSTKGNDAAAASTQLLGVMSKLLRPSQQAAEMLAEVGLSTDGIRQMIAEKGLLGTLEELRSILGDNGFVRFLEDTQAVQGGLGLLGGDLEKTRGIFEQVNDAAGATDEAFGKWAESMGAENARAFAQFQVALIRVGDALAPIAADVAGALASIVEAFSELPDGAQKAIIAVAGIAAAVGPLLSVGGRLITVWGGVMKAFAGMQSWTVSAGAISGAFNQTGASADQLTGRVSRLGQAAKLAAGAAGIAALGAAIYELHKAQVDADIEQLAEEFLAGADAAEQMQRVFSEGDWGPLTTGGDANRMLGEFNRLLDQSTESATRFVDQLEEAHGSNDTIDAMREAIERKSEADRQAASDADASSAAVDAQAEAMEGAASATGEATSALENYADALKAQVDPIFAAMDAMNGIRDAQVGYEDALIGVAEAQVALDEATAEHGATSAEAAAAQRDLEAAQRGLTDAQWAQVTSAAEADAALAGLLDAVERGDVSVPEFEATLQQWVAQGFLPAGAAADIAAGAVRGLTSDAQEADRQRVGIPVGQRGAATTRAQLHGVRDAAQDAGRQRPNVHTSTSGTSLSRAQLHGVRDAAYSIPSSVTSTVTVIHKKVFITEQQQGFTTGGAQIYHEGGVVPGPRGQEVAAILQAGERVLALDDPLNKALAGGGSVVPGPGGGFAGGVGGMSVYVDLRGAMVPNGFDFEKAVARALSRAGEHGRPVTMRGRRL